MKKLGENNVAILEAILFAAGEAVPLSKLTDIMQIETEETLILINTLNENYKNSLRGIFIREINNSFQLCTKPDYYDYIQKLFGTNTTGVLTQPLLETLAIIAYNQPITRSKIESIRGVNADNAVLKLLEKGLIYESGRMDCVGKPILYNTTDEFLKSFGLKSMEELDTINKNEKPSPPTPLP